MTIRAAILTIAALVAGMAAGQRALTDIEGTWQWSTGAVVSITADERGAVQLTLEDTPDPCVKTPQPMGAGRFSGADGTYVLQVCDKVNYETGRFADHKANITAQVDDRGQLTLQPYKPGYRVNLWRLVPYLFRFSVIRDKEPAGLGGARRIRPLTGTPAIPLTL